MCFNTLDLVFGFCKLPIDSTTLCLLDNKHCFLYNFIPRGFVTQVSALGQTVDQKICVE